MSSILSRASVLSAFVVAFAPLALSSAPALASGMSVSSSGACEAIAQAKVREWNQAKLMRDRMDTMADGTMRPSVLIFTENGMFEKVRGLWRTGQATRHQRSAGSAEYVIRRMGLTDCSNAGMFDVDGEKATAYDYAQDDDMKSRIWISDATGLPIRVEIAQGAGKDNRPVKVSMRYIYNDDVKVPPDAERRNNLRMMYSRNWLKDQANNTPGTVH